MTDTYMTVDDVVRLMEANGITWKDSPESIEGRFELALDVSRYELARVDRMEITTDAGTCAVESWWFDEAPPEARVFLPDGCEVEAVRQLAHVLSALSDLVRESPDGQVRLTDLVPILVSHLMRGQVVPG